MWICPLVHSLIGFCNDTILRCSTLLSDSCFPLSQTWLHVLTFYSGQLSFNVINLVDLYAVFRLCQDIVLLKSEVAELLLPNVIVNLAGRKDLAVDLCKLISSQVLLLRSLANFCYFILIFPLLNLLTLSYCKIDYI